MDKVQDLEFDGAAARQDLIDPFGRAITYLRVSVTDRCDFRCVYCMAENMSFLPKAEILSLEELDRLCSAFVARGVRKLRLTGGEPLVVSVSSSRSPEERWRDNEATRVMMPRRTSGSPPVRRSLRTPRAMKAEHSRSSSSRESRSAFGKKVMFSAMQ